MRQHIAGQVEIHRAFLAVHGFPKGNTDIFGHPLSHINAIRRLDHGLHHGDLIHLLKGVERGRPHGSRPTDGNNRSGIRPGVGQSGHGVGRARTGRRNTDAGLARDPRVGVGHHGRGLFVADIDALHAQVETGRRGAAGRPAHHEENGIDVFSLETLCNQFFASNGAHDIPPFFPALPFPLPYPPQPCGFNPIQNPPADNRTHRYTHTARRQGTSCHGGRHICFWSDTYQTGFARQAPGSRH